MLTVIPGVTPQVATAVRTLYPTMEKLVVALGKSSTDEEHAVKRIAASSRPGSSRKIGPAVAERLKLALVR